MGEAGDSFWWADLPFCGEDEGWLKDHRVQQPLEDMLVRLCVPEQWLKLLGRCDWPSLQQRNTIVHMVTSVPVQDSSEGGVIIKYGMDRLRDVLRGLPKFPPSSISPVYVQVWSLGGATDRWYTDFALALTQERYADLGVIAQWKHDHVRFIFEEEGRGPNMRRKQENELRRENRLRKMLDMEEKTSRPSELKQALWSEQGHPLLKAKKGVPRVSWGWHSKVMTREYPQGFCKRPDCQRVHGWRYLGSHNCSRSCWGWSYYDRDVNQAVMQNPSSWEMGMVLVSIPASSAVDECGADLNEVAPLPFQKANLHHSHPCTKYLACASF